LDSETIYSFMKECRYGVVSSLSGSGVPQSALVGIAVTPELEIIFDTLKSTRKYPNLIAHPKCSIVVGWDGEQTVQLEGVAREPEDAERSRYLEIYFAVWPECRSHLQWPGIAHFVVKPAWVRYSDYDQNPPLIKEIEGPR
jgi:pyridoxine/pyridoxamine 5'-phosphate oxidase